MHRSFGDYKKGRMYILETNKLIAILIAAMILTTSMAHANTENQLSEPHCREVMKGEPGEYLDGGYYVDCLTDTHAIEYDWAEKKKLYEAIGQALTYAWKTGKRAGIVLILRDDGDREHLANLIKIINHHGLPVDVWWVGE